ncbi:MAG: CHASE domain-containing protein [Mariniphaga sp.]
MKINQNTDGFKFQKLLRKSASTSLEKSLIILFIALFITALRTVNSYQSALDEAYGDFVSDVNDGQDKITENLKTDAQLLQSATALFAASDAVTRAEWHLFVEHSKIDSTPNHDLGIGYVMNIAKNQIRQHIEKIRKEGFPDYIVTINRTSCGLQDPT